MSKKKKTREVLSDYQPHEARELIPITHRFSAVIAQLREDGDMINTIQIDHNKFVYQMHQPRGEQSEQAA